MRIKFIAPILSLPLSLLTIIGGNLPTSQATSFQLEADLKSPLLLAQNNNTEATSWSENWDDHENISNNFIKGCIGETSDMESSQRSIQQGYCSCVLEAYQERYTPELFTAINSYAIQAESFGVILVNLMMEPELKTCSDTTGFER